MMSKMVERSGSAEIVLMLLFTWVVPAICDPTSQLTFSIDCGTTENYTDENGITWTSDAGFIATGQNAQNLTVIKNVTENFFNTEQSQSLRFFDQGRGRDCYVLPVESEFIYLVRPTFYYGDWNSPENYTSFDVYLNANKFLNFEFNATQESYYQILTFEALVYPSGATALDVCLVRKAGTPFISSLELRQLDRGMYSSTVAINKYLGTWQRLNYGVNVSDYIYLRYPDDIYDRIWSTAQDIGFLPQDYGINVSNKSNIPVSNSLTPERPPVKVMEDYLTYPNSSYLTITSQSEYPFGPIAAYSYFQEVDESANASHVRGMDFYFNNFPLETFNTSNEPSEISSCLLYITDTMLNITLNQSSSSKLKPILNALEIYLVYDWNAAKTAIEDVKSIDTIKGLFNLNDWYGDPCLPVPYDWLDCDIPYTEASTATNNQTNVQGMVNTTAYVTSISLTNIAIVQTFPEEVLLFSHLTSLSLKNTSLESIPSSLSSGMENLISLDVSNNKISGRVVDFVQNITAASNATSLQVLYAENNLLEGEFLLDEFYSQFPELEEAYFDTNKNISGILNLTSLQTALITGSGNNTAKYTGKAAIVPPAGTGSTLPLISLTNNQITGITPSLDTLSDDISNFLRTRNSFNDLNGVLLGGNPWCEQTQFDQQPLSQQYLCRSSSSSALPGITNLSSKGTNVGAIVGGVVGGVAFLFFLICLLVIWKLHKRTSSLKEIQEALARQKVQPPFYSYAALRAATHDFSPANKLGQGSFGAVYKGAVLDTTDGTQELVAVKKLYSSKQALSEFLNEAVLITGIKHRNLVQLKGCCIYKEDERMLVYEYAENGNLAEALLGAQGNDKPEEQQTRLDWRQRLNICVGIARGLSYLHEELQPRIIHRDIKPSNILLDANYNAKIADFGLARSILEGQTQADFTQVAGTKGYFSPEYATQGQLTEKADVFSFGVVLLEIVSGRKWRDDRLPPEKQFLQAWARHLKNEGKLLDLLDPKVRKSAHDDEVIRVISLAFLCLEFDPLKRPTMSETVTMLQGITSVTLYKADSDTSSTFPSPIGQGVYNYMKLPTSLDDLSEKLVVDSFETSASSSTTPNTGIEFSRLAAR